MSIFCEFSPSKMVIFHSYVRLPEGNVHPPEIIHGFWCISFGANGEQWQFSGLPLELDGTFQFSATAPGQLALLQVNLCIWHGLLSSPVLLRSAGLLLLVSDNCCNLLAEPYEAESVWSCFVYLWFIEEALPSRSILAATKLTRVVYIASYFSLFEYWLDILSRALVGEIRPTFPATSRGAFFLFLSFSWSQQQAANVVDSTWVDLIQRIH